MDAIETLLQEEKEEEDLSSKGEHFSFLWLAKTIVELRQNYDKDIIIVITGDRRNGKSTWILKLIKEIIKLKRAEDPSYKWSWKDNFPLSRSDAASKADKVPEGSFIAYDEGGDIAYRGDTLSLMNKRLVKFMLKSGKKKLITLIALPDVFILDPKILNMATFLVTIPYRYRDECAFAFIYGRTPNPFTQDKFGLERIKRALQSRKTPRSLFTPTVKMMSIVRNGQRIEIPYPKDLFLFLKSVPTFLHAHRFRKLNKRWADSYEKNVKSKQLFMHEYEDRYIKKITYDKLALRYATLLYNLRTRGLGKEEKLSYVKLQKLHIDPKTRESLAGVEHLKRIINNYSMGVGDMYGTTGSD